MSESAFAHLDEIEREVRRHRGWHFLLDFDGTLAPIVDHPEEAQLDSKARLVLTALTSLPGVHVSIVSGRALDDLRGRVPPDLMYAGNHGLEIEGREIHFREHAIDVDALRALLPDLHGALDHIPGVMIEDKQLSASVHFRNADPSNESTILDIVVRRLRGAPFHIRRGNKVFEIRPNVAWHKGSAARLLLESSPGALPIAVGDDETDEDIFLAIPHGLTVRIGDKIGTAARYFVHDRLSALRLLRMLSLYLEDAGRDRTRR